MAFCTLGPIWSRNARLARWGRSTPFPHAHRGNRPIFRSMGFPLNQCWIMCSWTPQDRWGPPEHPRDTSHAFSASCCRPPIRPVSPARRAALADTPRQLRDYTCSRSVSPARSKLLLTLAQASSLRFMRATHSRMRDAIATRTVKAPSQFRAVRMARCRCTTHRTRRAADSLIFASQPTCQRTTCGILCALSSATSRTTLRAR